MKQAKQRTTAEKKNPVKEITEKLEQGIQDLVHSEAFQKYLNTMSKFYNYSYNNTLLIAMQKPEASYVAGFHAWQRDFERHVKKGEKGIKIIAPRTIKKLVKREQVDPVTRKVIKNQDGNPKKEKVEVQMPGFQVVTVFDISQTEGKELPSIGTNELCGNVQDYPFFIKTLEQVSPVPVEHEKIESGAKGYYHVQDKKIVLQEQMSEMQTVKTLIHEIAHAMLHNREAVLVEGIEEDDKKNRRTKEVEAESVAYTVCQRYGIDTSEYSFAYIAGWSSGMELKELKQSMDTIQKTVSQLITQIDGTYRKQKKEAVKVSRKSTIKERLTAGEEKKKQVDTFKPKSSKKKEAIIA